MEKYYIYKCPVCGSLLKKYDRVYKCKSGHSYDISSEGYVNLLLANKKNSKNPGDSKEMIVSRNNFLKKGYYKNLSEAINETVKKYVDVEQRISIFDSGCGEGYYLDNLARSLEERENISYFGIDISKDALKYTAKRNGKIEAAVASAFEIPVMNRSVQCVLSIFAPFKEEEFLRILKDEGILIIVSPGAYHLDGLKKALYEEIYLNDEEKLNLKHFNVLEKIKIRYEFTLDNKEDISNLIKMTPYYWNTDMAKIKEIMNKLEELTTFAEFIITVFRKESNSQFKE